MPHLLDTPSRTEALVRASWHLIDEGGIPAVTLRRLADLVNLGASTICHHLGHRERMFRVLAHRTGDWYRRRVAARIDREGLAAFLPSDEEELVALRAWLAWSELGRAEGPLGAALARGHAHERGLVEIQVYRETGAVPDPDLVEALVALVRGLQLAVTLRPGATDPARAAAVLGWAAAQLMPVPGEPADPAAAAAVSRSAATMASGSSAE